MPRWQHSDPVTAPPGALTSAQIARMAGGLVIAVALCIWLVDRPVANFAHEVTLPHRWWFAALTRIVDPLPVMAWLICVGYIILALGGGYPGPNGRLALRIALALIVAIYLKDGIKGVAGRSWPETWTANNLSYIRDGVYGFFPMQGFSGTRAYQAFPSGHLTAITSIAVSLALAVPSLRWIAPLPVALVAIGMIGANFHWVSDLVAGAGLGAAVALAAHRLGLAFERPVDTSHDQRARIDQTD